MFTEYLFCLLCTAESNDHAPTHFRNSPNHTVKWAVSQANSGRFRTPYILLHNKINFTLQRTIIPYTLR